MNKPLNDYIRPHVLELARGGALFSVPLRCTFGGCEAVVRFVGDKATRGSWHCPVCGCARPYVFWSLRVDHDYCFDAKDPQLVIQLASDCCDACGEANPPCRCDRERADKAEQAGESKGR
ncbi:MAG: hypothetical protein ACXWQ5_00720 [Ktedonobacterales bacterium]